MKWSARFLFARVHVYLRFKSRKISSDAAILRLLRLVKIPNLTASARETPDGS